MPDEYSQLVYPEIEPMKRKTAPHMGRAVKKVARQQGYNATTLAPLLKMSASPMSKVFRRPFLHSVLLLRLCNALDYDFFALLCRCSKEPPFETSEYEVRIKELERENTSLRKENGMLQKMVELLEKKN